MVYTNKTSNLLIYYVYFTNRTTDRTVFLSYCQRPGDVDMVYTKVLSR